MLRATKDIAFRPPLPARCRGRAGTPKSARDFMVAMVGTAFREQYLDAVTVYLHEQEIAGLDIPTDGDAHFDSEVGGQSWTNYPFRHMGGFHRTIRRSCRPAAPCLSARTHPARLPGSPRHVRHRRAGRRGNLQYAAIWKAAQRLTHRPVKFGTIGPELVAFAVKKLSLQGLRDRILAIAEA